ncbi:MAG: Membrane protein involved in the export of O-antigen and teichoic acid [Candidatus Woesebacteria bacterium GW2011_GWA1_39_12]|uniref:Membrane protein involved in the export of O-antigen and teichoic acid n=1 Tax=Candidatus Woesebacteria bacterium GW2011_GWA1_39_12 TaxID=1618549 RepID=A0A0G0LY96_9BACT|nr:MAG: Membrane protein involved in the export of O-antigen and teichoic acid [Candidatus Woesebacteria bacterium GW2011_GWA1_39_12]
MDHPQQHLTRKSLKAGAWLTAYRGFARLSGLIKAVVVARLLTPSQIGVFGFASLALNLFETFSETGIESALIQKKSVSPSLLTAGWLLGLLRSLALSLLLIFIAPFVAAFFDNPDLTFYIRLISLTPILRNLRNPQLILLKKKLAFAQESLMRGLGAAVEIVIAITLTLMWRNVLALVVSIVAAAAAETISSYLLIARPRLARPNFSQIKGLLNFGKWVWSGSTLSFIVNQGDDIVVGKLLGPAALGFYQYAYKIASLPTTEITGTISQVVFPAFANIQSDSARLGRAVKKSIVANTIITLPISLFTLIFAHPLTLLLYGPTWLPLVPSLRILAIFGIFRALYTILCPLAVGIGKPQYLTINGILRAIVLFALIFPLSLKYNIVGASWASLIAIAASVIFMIYQLRSYFFHPDKVSKNENSLS